MFDESPDKSTPRYDPVTLNLKSQAAPHAHETDASPHVLLSLLTLNSLPFQGRHAKHPKTITSSSINKILNITIASKKQTNIS